MNHPLVQLLLRWLVLAVGVTIATKVINGIHCDSRETLLVVVLLLSFLNAILKPLLMLMALPFIVMTMGLGVVLINALLFSLVGKLVDGFYIDGFWSAIGGAIVVSLTGLVANFMLGGNRPRGPRPPMGGGGGWQMPRQAPPPRNRTPDGRGDVIDI